MIDWQNMKFEDLTFEPEADSIQDIGPTLIIPVKVCLRDGTPVFTQQVSLRSDFFRQLKESPDWEPALMRILKNRVREEFLRRRQQSSVLLEDRLKLIQSGPQPLS